jgi:hypothetical protein
VSIEQADTIDFVGIDKVTGKVVLTISDHLDWTDSKYHLSKLQEKLNCYLRFCESGELCESYPEAKGKDVVFSVAAKHPFSAEGMAFFVKAKATIARSGFILEIKTL